MLASFNEWLMDITNAPVLYLPAFGVLQAVDIFIVAVLLYFVIRWIRKTQAWVLLKGIAFILVIALAAEIFDLVTVQWIVDNAIGMGLVVIVILFQPELRKALEQIGRGPFLQQLISENEQTVLISSHTADEITKAARQMSENFTGALIVMEQEVDLSEHERTGVPLDAQVSTQLLISLFEKNTPLHDGAVIIRGNRVSAAACILPLSGESLDSAFGTRHRAAVGICEVSDARVLVVSEETGCISIVSDGKITRDVSDEAIQDALLFGQLDKTPRFTFFKNRRRL